MSLFAALLFLRTPAHATCRAGDIVFSSDYRLWRARSEPGTTPVALPGMRPLSIYRDVMPFEQRVFISVGGLDPELSVADCASGATTPVDSGEFVDIRSVALDAKRARLYLSGARRDDPQSESVHGLFVYDLRQPLPARPMRIYDADQTAFQGWFASGLDAMAIDRDGCVVAPVYLDATRWIVARIGIPGACGGSGLSEISPLENITCCGFALDHAQVSHGNTIYGAGGLAAPRVTASPEGGMKFDLVQPLPPQDPFAAGPKQFYGVGGVAFDQSRRFLYFARSVGETIVTPSVTYFQTSRVDISRVLPDSVSPPAVASPEVVLSWPGEVGGFGVLPGCGDNVPACTDQSAPPQGPCKIPLGHESPEPGGTPHSGPKTFCVYVPTKDGGKLKAWTGDDETAPQPDISISAPNGTVIVTPSNNEIETKPHGPGWYSIRADRPDTFQLSNTFVQAGISRVRPWNGWFFPMTGSRTLYELGGPLDHYQFVPDPPHINPAEDWEPRHHSTTGDGDGHCWGLAAAQVSLPIPKVRTSAAPQDLTPYDLMGLWAELTNDAQFVNGEHWRSCLGLRPTDSTTRCFRYNRGAPPSLGLGNANDFADDMHIYLLKYLRRDGESGALNLPLVANLGPRCPESVSADATGRWTHAVFSFASAFTSTLDDPSLVRVETEVRSASNSSHIAPNSSPFDLRQDAYSYQLRFVSAADANTGGSIQPEGDGQKWLSAVNVVPGGCPHGEFIPSVMGRVDPMWATRECKMIHGHVNPCLDFGTVVRYSAN